MIIENKKIVELLTEKEALVLEIRKVAGEIESFSNRIKRCEEKEKRITGKVPVPKDLQEKGDKLEKDIHALMDELEKVGKEVENLKLAAVPPELKTEHLDLMKQREDKDREMNKIALKVQKIKDKVIPLIKKEVKPLLKTEYDDIETAKIKDGKLVITTFNHVEDFKRTFRNRPQK